MRNVLNDGAVRDRIIGIAVATLAAVMVTGSALVWLDAGPLRTLALLALVATVAGGGGALGMVVQQHQLGCDVSLRPLAVARWSGALTAAVLGPLATGAVGIGVVVGLGSLLVPAESGGSLAGVGGVSLVLPMALLVTGTASLRTVAVALARDLEIREVIAVAEGHEWSLVPVGLALAFAVLACTAGIVGLALGVVPASLAIVIGLAALLPASAALAGHWERLGAS
ncbi:MAG: hypothetical protein V2J24_13115 [Pseudomonadales bacterium]|jgi:hypothetical protein|nr:hypothetical protein [Pseudomonadales bacterium]